MQYGLIERVNPLTAASLGLKGCVNDERGQERKREAVGSGTTRGVDRPPFRAVGSATIWF